MYERLEQPEMLRALNALHAKFYENRRRQLEEQLNPATIEIAMAQRESEAKRGVSFNQWSFEGAISDAAQSMALINRESARKGGSSRKTDSLQEIILKLVRESPKITRSELLQKLNNMGHGQVITDIDDSSEPGAAIHFVDRNGMIKDAPLSGLKDRLSRAKKLFPRSSRKADSANR